MTAPTPATTEEPRSAHRGLMVLAWCWVGAPFGYGIYELALKVAKLFGG